MSAIAAACAIGRRRASLGLNTRTGLALFSAIGLIEGVVWSIGIVGVSATRPIEQELTVLLLGAGVAAGAAPNSIHVFASIISIQDPRPSARLARVSPKTIHCLTKSPDDGTLSCNARVRNSAMSQPQKFGIGGFLSMKTRVQRNERVS